MNKYRSFLVLAFLTITLFACNNTYFNKAIMSKVKSHSIIAVLPPIVSMCPRNIEFDTIMLSEIFRSQIVENVGKKLRFKNRDVEILNLDSTYLRLARIDFFENNIPDPVELCKTLGVDAIIVTEYELHLPIECERGKFPNKVRMRLDLYDKNSNVSIFRYYESRKGKTQKSNIILAQKLSKEACNMLLY